MNQTPQVFILRMRHVPFINATEINRLKEFHRRLKSAGTTIIISGANRKIREEFLKAGLYKALGENNIHKNINDAIIRAEQLLEQ
jgi:sulfate permease, SulP family